MAAVNYSNLPATQPGIPTPMSVFPDTVYFETCEGGSVVLLSL